MLGPISNHLATDFEKIEEYQEGWKYRTHALFGITLIFIPDKEPKYWSVRLNTGRLATLLITEGVDHNLYISILFLLLPKDIYSISHISSRALFQLHSSQSLNGINLSMDVVQPPLSQP